METSQSEEQFDQQTNLTQDSKTFKFQGEIVPPKFVFIQRRYIFAMVHPQPVTAGHVLICPIRENVNSITQLSELETLEIFVCAKEIIKVFEDVFKVKNFMTLCQDGLYAKDFQSRAKQGEKCQGFCLQVLPQNEKLGTQKNVENAIQLAISFSQARITERKQIEMVQEADKYRSLFVQGSGATKLLSI